MQVITEDYARRKKNNLAGYFANLELITENYYNEHVIGKVNILTTLATEKMEQHHKL